MRVLILLIAIWIGRTESAEVTCTKAFCEELIEKQPCPKLSEKCKPDHSKTEALDLPYPGPCNCCPYCLEYLELGDECPIGEQTSIVPASLCGPGLKCKIDPQNSRLKTCELMDTPCALKQQEFDNNVATGKVGNLQLRENCDERGQYAPFKCIPGQICYCVDENGERIFGEIPYTTLASVIMNCGCSRHNTKAERLLGSFANTWSKMRCNDDGSFDPIQCVNDRCLCVDKLDGQPSFPDDQLVKVDDVNNKTIRCFDETIHKENNYYRNCEEIYRRRYKDDRKYIDDGFDVIGSIYPKCQDDGYYARIQESETKIYCADINGEQIDDYSIEKKPENEALIKEMNCNCARANLITKGLDKAKCKKNGNYEPMQCMHNECRCVDLNGNQVRQEVDADLQDTLNC